MHLQGSHAGVCECIQEGLSPFEVAVERDYCDSHTDVLVALTDSKAVHNPFADPGYVRMLALSLSDCSSIHSNTLYLCTNDDSLFFFVLFYRLQHRLNRPSAISI